MTRKVRWTGALLGLAGAALPAWAQPSAMIDLRLSTDGVNWTDHVDVVSGTLVHAAIYVSVTNAYGFGGASISSLNLRGMNGQDGVAFAPGTELSTGRVAPFNFGAATNRIFTAADGYRIDAATDPDNTNTAAGMIFAQRDPATADPGTYRDGTAPRMAFAFDVAVGQGHSLADALSFEFGPLVRGVCTVHTSFQASRGTPISAVTLDGASITVVPAPATLVVAGLGGLLAGRRRP